MSVQPRKFIRKPFSVEAVEVTAENMAEVAQWCRGRIRYAKGPRGNNSSTRFIKVNVKRPLDEKQTEAYVGDWVVTATDKALKGFKVYTPRAFLQTFDEIAEDMVATLERMGQRVIEEEAAEDDDRFPEELRVSDPVMP